MSSWLRQKALRNGVSASERISADAMPSTMLKSSQTFLPSTYCQARSVCRRQSAVASVRISDQWRQRLRIKPDTSPALNPMQIPAGSATEVACMLGGRP